MSWIISEIKIQGVKGVLDHSGDFVLASKKKPKSIVVFAPNGCGKSGYADAIEYIFSEEGMVEHLGKGGADSERGGKHALPHVLAEEKGIDSLVSLSLLNIETGEIVNAIRQVRTGRSDNRPPELENVMRLAPAHRILRQHDLRRFVVEMSPGDKYSELSRWIGLTKLEQILKHLVTTSNLLQNTDLDREIAEREKDIKTNTNQEIDSYDLALIYEWCSNQAEVYLNRKIEILEIGDISIVVKELQKARDNLILVSSASGAYEAKQSLEKDLPNFLETEGALNKCLMAFKDAQTAEKTYEEAKDKVKNSLFNEVWSTSKSLLTAKTLKVCPVCKTHWERTEVGSQSEAVVWLQSSLHELSELKTAENNYFEKTREYKTSLSNLIAEWSSVISNLGKLGAQGLVSDAKNYLIEMNSIQVANKAFADLQKDVDDLLGRLRIYASNTLRLEIKKFEVKGLPKEVIIIDQLIKNIENLLTTVNRLQELEVERQEYRKVEKSYNSIADVIRDHSAQLTNQIVNAFREDVLSIYRAIHPSSAVPNIYIVPNTEERTLGLRIDFHQSGRTVPPAGYLSESYINTLGLALFISSVRLFNREFPFIFLDDIVSSYDADHRARIVDVIAERLEGFQIFLTTHDWRFYTMLRDRLSNKDWKFEKIASWSFEHGPQREADTLRPDEIDQIIKNEDPSISGNIVRQYMEDWLDKMCAKFFVFTLHKRGFKDFDRTLFDYWDPFIKRLGTIKSGFFENQILTQDCFDRLKTHSLLNYYSHAQANPYEWPSLGDVLYVWVEFQAFQKLFLCFSCGNQLHYEEDSNNVYCTCGNKIFHNSKSGTN